MASFIRSDLEFILQQIMIAEANAAGQSLNELVPNSFVPFGLRTVDGSLNHIVDGQSPFGAADVLFPRMTDPVFRPAEAGTSYSQNGGLVIDSQPRIISNLVVDQTISNPSAVQAYVDAGLGVLAPDGTLLDFNGVPIPAGLTLGIPNTAPDVGLSAPFNAWFTFFGQFFDHGLDLLNKGGSGTVFVPLQPDDPLYVPGSPTNFMVLTRATNQPGADGILGTADDIHEHTNQTTPFVDQNQTYTSHPSHQVFLREYALNAAGDPVATGRMITNRNLVDGVFGNGNDIDLGGMATWAVVKAQARDLLGIVLDDMDALDLPLLATDAYGSFIRGANGFPQLVTSTGLVEGNPAAPVDASIAIRTGHPFLADIAHAANPVGDHDGNPFTPNAPLTPDADNVVGGTPAVGTYDNELLDAHFMAGDGRVNENIALTAVHHVFHAEHNRLVEHTKAVVLATGDAAFIAQWQLSPGVWNGERLFQAAKFGTEMQYQHLVFEEFARKVQPMVDVFLAPTGFDTTIDPAIVAEFAHAVYRFGHSMLLDTVDRLDPAFASSEIGLIEAFLNPLAFASGGLTAEQAAGAIVRGTTRQAGNEIDEFVTDVLRNNLLGLPLDLPTINMTRARDTGIPSLNAARRDFYAMTSDSQLKPYTSWLDLTSNLKHELSVVNFIAAYGTHTSITSATTLADKRAAAFTLVFGGAGEPADRLDFLNSTGAWASAANGVTTTGVDAIDLWVGGLAEKQMPFGGMLGSTFNFVFETQMEALQNGDRFYYLARLAGLNFLTEMENNSFAKLVMLNTNATHLPAEIFTTPGFILEVDQTQQFNANVVNNPGPDLVLGDNPLTLANEAADDIATPNADPLGGTALIPLIIRDNPATVGPDTNFLHYTGVDHVVLGGTDPGNLANPSGNDILIASIGDDTLWGGAGNDRLEGGDGVDNIEGGDGNDIITDWGGDDVLKGNAGDDVIHGGNGFNLILGGDGSDFIITGEDVSETFGGAGNDFILGAQMNLPTFGNEGDDWIEIGTSDGAAGDNFAPLENSPVIGHDVIITGGGFDEADGEGGHDIMVMSDGEDHFGGGGGFDWASYKNDQFGVAVDMTVNDFIEPPVAPSNQGILDRFAQVEGLTGSAFSDILRGDNADAAAINLAGTQNSTLDATGIGLITGLQGFLNQMLGTVAVPVVTSFNSGNIILGGGSSDIIEGRGGDDLIDGDRWLNVRIAVANPAAGQPASVDSLTELVPFMLSGAITPSQLSIVRELNTAAGFDTAMFSDIRANYNIATDLVTGVTTVTHLPDPVTGVATGIDGTDRLVNIERLQFADFAVSLQALPTNSSPVGLLTITEATPGVLTASAADNPLTPLVNEAVTDADNISLTNPTGAITGRISFVWQVERDPVAAPGVFQDIIALGGGNPATAHGNTFRVTPDLVGLAIRARAVYQDGAGVLENVFSTPTTATVAGAPAPAPAILPAESPTTSPGGGLHLIRGDLQFILDQIVIGEANSGLYGTPAQDLLSLLPNSRVPFGVRTVDGTLNNLVQLQTNFGAADQNFPLLLDQVFRNDPTTAPFPGVINTNYATTGPGTGNVVDSDPRMISNLIVDQTITNPSAVEAFLAAGQGTQALDALGNPTFNPDGTPIILDLNGVAIPRNQTLTIPNVATDEGLSAPFNSWFTFFGQFFDHGLDLVNKGGTGTVFIPLLPDDPLITHGRDGIAGTGDELTNPGQQFMVLTRATNTAVQAGVDGIFNTADDVHFQNNQTTPFVDQNQTYTSHPSHQVFLREYVLDATGRPVATGKMLDGTNPDGSRGGLPTWADVKAQAQNMLGIQLDDLDVLNLPLLATDAYGKFIPDPLTGFAQIVTLTGLQSGTPAAPIDATLAGRTNHAFLDDIAHTANPRNSQTGAPLTPDADGVAGGPVAAGFYDNELLDRHFATGDGRGNENIGLTSVHHVFHSEHNRMVEHTKQVVLASNDPTFIAQWLLPGANQADGIQALEWNGERLFQAARFSTEMQYQHLVFEEFARKMQPQVDVFLGEGQGYDSTINPAIVAEFAHAVFRLGHSMLPDTVNRLDPNFASSEIGLIEAFLNPLAFNQNNTLSAAEAAGAVVRGMTRQVGNEIDNFVTEAVRNNLLGLPLDLPAINLARGRDTGVPSLNAARRDFFNSTGDTQLKPYTSWVDLAMNLRHESSVVNFIAAYGTHTNITSAITLADKRAAATALVLGVVGESAATTADRLAFLNSTGIYANDPVTGATTTGVDVIDLWVGGIAERQMPFGGLLGSTFNYVFENQMEKLQNGDRFYYLERTAGLNFLTELENNSFAKLIMANTNATHLPGDVFSTPGLILEVDPTRQFTGLGLDNRADPVGDGAITPLVIRDNPATPGLDTNYLRYTGDQHVVLGGTAANDTIIASEGDDTLYGDVGNDRLEGGFGNDILFGGVGDDILTDLGGDDNIQGGDGNDAIQGGNGINLMLGGFGNDFIVTGEDESESFGGPGNDFIKGVAPVEMVFGNEGDDWLEAGMADGSSGENFDTRGLDAIIGNDVFIGDTISDRMLGEGGDDIMVGNGGQVDRYIGASGFDWAVFKDHPTGAAVDMRLDAFVEAPVPATAGSILDRFSSVEGLSGSAFGDILQGDDANAAAIAVSGFTGSVLTNISLINGLQAFLGAGVTSFGAGNIILGGNGSDIIEGRGGDDLIDGDKWLNVRISVRDTGGNEIGTTDSMTGILQNKSGVLAGTPATLTLDAAVFAGAINPGQLVIVREILTATGPSIDTAVFSGNLADYSVSTVAGVTTVTDNVGVDGTDRLTNIERLQFNDGSVVLVPGLNSEAVGVVRLNDATPAVGQVLTAGVAGLGDADNATVGGAISGSVAYFWQFEARPGLFQDILVASGLGTDKATGRTFTVTPDLEGFALRVKAVYQDGHGVLETVFSAPTAATTLVGTANNVGAALVLDTTPTEGAPVSATVTDTDVPGPVAHQWQVGGIGVTFTDIAGATGATFTPTQAEVGLNLRVMASYTDNAGNLEQVFSVPTTVAGDLIIGTPGPDTLIGTAGDDNIQGLGGDDSVTGGSGADTMAGGTGNDSYEVTDAGDVVVENAGEGIDTIWTAVNYSLVGSPNVENLMFGGTGNFTGTGNDLDNTIVSRSGNDVLNGGAGNDVLNSGAGDDSLTGGSGGDAMSGGTGNDSYEVTDIGDLAIEIAGEGIDTITTSLAGFSLVGSNIENLMFGGVGNFTGTGNDFANTMQGGSGDDTLNGGAGDDSITGGSGGDAMSGGTGNDSYEVTEVGDLAIEIAGEGVDTVWTSLAGFSLVGSNIENLRFGGTGNFTGTGNDFANAMQGGSGGDTLNGGAGDDSLTGGSGADAMFGGTGNDSYEVTDAVDVVQENTGEGIDTIWTSVNYALINTSAVEILMFGGSGNFTGTGNDLDNTIVGRGGADTLDGGAGNDTLNGGAGHDTLIGGTGIDTMTGGVGNDTYEVADAGDVVVENAGEGIDTIRSLLAGFSLVGSNIENLMFGGVGNFTGTGNDFANTMQGGSGDDTLNGGAGDDSLTGGSGGDAMSGGTGNDSYEVTDMGDLAIESAGEGVDTVWTSLAGFSLEGSNVENLRFGGTGNFTGTGNDFANAMQGGSGDDTLNGGAGDDAITGGSGGDAMSGGTGNDSYEVTEVGDLAIEIAGEGIDTVWTSLGGFSLVGSNIENLMFGGTGIFIGTGNDFDNLIVSRNGADTLDGGAGNDTLNSGAGHDTLIGGTGNDAMTGGYGNDMFVYSALNFGNDRITDFDADPLFGQDLLNISGLGVTAANFASLVSITDTGADTLVSFGGGTIQLIGVGDATTVNASDFLLT